MFGFSVASRSQPPWGLNIRSLLNHETSVECSSEGLDLSGRMRHSAVSAQPTNAHPIERKINDRGGVEGQHLAENQATDNGDAEGFAKFGTGSGAQGERQSAEECRHGGHEDWPKTQNACLEDGVSGRLAIHAFGSEGEIDHHDGVLFDDANQENDSDDGDNTEIQVKNHQGQKGADTSGR